MYFLHDDPDVRVTLHVPQPGEYAHHQKTHTHTGHPHHPTGHEQASHSSPLIGGAVLCALGVAASAISWKVIRKSRYLCARAAEDYRVWKTALLSVDTTTGMGKTLFTHLNQLPRDPNISTTSEGEYKFRGQAWKTFIKTIGIILTSLQDQGLPLSSEDTYYLDLIHQKKYAQALYFVPNLSIAPDEYLLTYPLDERHSLS